MKTTEFIKIRKGVGWSQAKLAKRLGVSMRTVQRIEKGSKINKLIVSRMNDLKSISDLVVVWSV